MDLCVFSPKGEKMSVIDVLVIMLNFGMFILALLTYIEITRKK